MKLWGRLAAFGIAALLCTGTLAAGLESSDQRFLERAAQANQLEILASELALKQASNRQVKDFALKMAQEHHAMDAALKRLAAEKGMDLPPKPTQDQQDDLDRLARQQGEAFDNEYTEEIALQAHKDAIDLYDDAADSAVDPGVKRYALSALPDLKRYLELARNLDLALKDR